MVKEMLLPSTVGNSIKMGYGGNKKDSLCSFIYILCVCVHIYGQKFDYSEKCAFGFVFFFFIFNLLAVSSRLLSRI